MLLQSRNRRNTNVRFAAILLAVLFTMYLVGCSQEKTGPPKPKARPQGSGVTQTEAPEIDLHNTIAVIETDKGKIEVEFFADDAPKTVEKFIKNAQLGYYKNESFHRVESGKLIQAGSHLVTGTTIPIEKSNRQPVRGVIAMAKEQGASVADAAEFFICLDTLELDSDYTLFGKVTKGLDVIDRIKQGDKILNITTRDKG